MPPFFHYATQDKMSDERDLLGKLLGNFKSGHLMNEQLVLLERDAGVATLTLNRPEVINALNAALVEQLLDHLHSLEGDSSCRAVLITANGKGFCAGQDLKEIPFDSNIGEEVERVVTSRCNEIVNRLTSLRLPTVCAVHGVAAGAGASLALCADIVVADESASFVQAFSRIGLIPDTGATFLLPRFVGLAKAKALTMLAEPVVAEAAERLGMIYKVFPAASLHAEAKRIAEKLAALPTRALELSRTALLASSANTLDEQLALEAKLQRTAAETEDFREGVQAFLEKRQAQFSGK